MGILNRRRYAILFFLLGATWLSFARVSELGFIDLDDSEYITENAKVTAGLTMSGFKWAWTTFRAGNWHPLTWLSLQLDATLFAGAASGFHLTSLLCHALAACLLFLALSEATGSTYRSALVSLFFAIHPTACESVVWLAERKSVLAMLFGMLALFGYVRHARCPSRALYAAVLVCFLLGLLAKPVLVSLPLIFLLLDYWPLARRAPWIEKVPFFAGSLISSVMTCIAQSAGGAVTSLAGMPLRTRLANCVVSHALYLRHIFYPRHLLPFYPVPYFELFPARVAEALIPLAAISALAWHERRRRPYLLVGWLWFLVALFPSNGLVQVGQQGMADRYLYLPIIGILIAVTWGLAEISKASVVKRRAVSVVAVVFAIGLFFETRALTALWQSPETLWTYVKELDPDNWVANVNLATYLMEHDRLDESMALFKDALSQRQSDNALTPARTGEVLQNVGVLLIKKHQWKEARLALAKAIAINPKAGTFHNLGVAHQMEGDLEQARLSYLLAMEHGFPPPDRQYQEFGADLARAGRGAEAVSFLMTARAALLREGEAERARAMMEKARAIAAVDPRAAAFLRTERVPATEE